MVMLGSIKKLIFLLSIFWFFYLFVLFIKIRQKKWFLRKITEVNLVTLYSHQIHKNCKSDNSKYRRWYGAITTLTRSLWECKLIQLLWNYLVTLKICISCDPTIPFLSIYYFVQVRQEIYTRMSITTLFPNRM